MLYYPGKVRLYLTCPHLSGQRPADGQVIHGEAQAGPGDRQLNLDSDRKLVNEIKRGLRELQPRIGTWA